MQLLEQVILAYFLISTRKVLTVLKLLRNARRIITMSLTRRQNADVRRHATRKALNGGKAAQVQNEDLLWCVGKDENL